MVENRGWLLVLTHAILILGVAILAFPIWVAFVASTHDLQTLLQPPTPLLPGGEFFENYYKALTSGSQGGGGPGLADDAQ